MGEPGTARRYVNLARIWGAGLGIEAFGLVPLFWLRYHFGWSTWWPIHNVALSLVASLVLIDLTLYVVHQLQHNFAAMWRFHSVHHAPAIEEIDFHIGLHHHIGDMGLTLVLIWGVVMLTGMPLYAVIFTTLCLLAMVIWAHTEARPWHRHLEWLLVTPRSHLLHHVPEFDRYNLGVMLSFWDRRLGIYRPADAPPASFGVSHF